MAVFFAVDSTKHLPLIYENTLGSGGGRSLSEWRGEGRGTLLSVELGLKYMTKF